MIEISDSDFYPLEDFSLRWRWTDERWSKLSPETLRQINPIIKTKAVEIWEIQKQYLFQNGLNTDFFENREILRTELEDISVVREWLQKRIGNTKENVFVLWDENFAVKTTSDIFCHYWNDFCFPSSDDISVSPANLSWLLFYHHDDYLCFGKLKKEFIP